MALRKYAAGLRILHRDRAVADMHAEPLTGAAAEHGSIHRPRAAPVDVLVMPGPAEHVFGADVTRDHSIRVVGGVLAQGFDGDGIAGTDFGLRRQRAAEIAPMH